MNFTCTSLKPVRQVNPHAWGADRSKRCFLYQTSMRVGSALVLTTNILTRVAHGAMPRGFSTMAMKATSSSSKGSEDAGLMGLDVGKATTALRRAEAVCFDVDSTVIPEEGVDVLADFKDQGEAVAELTRQAMEGSVDFRTALDQRLSLIQPTKQDFDVLLKQHPVVLSPGVQELIDLLHARGTHVYLVSGGFRQMINSVAEATNIPYNRIYANNILFGENGKYAGFDKTEPTSSDGGKAAVISMLKEVHGYQTVVMVGDGATDMQAAPPADAFIGYGGTAVRENVMAGADLFVVEFEDIMRLLK